MLRNHNSNLCNDHNKKINVLSHLAVPSVVFKACSVLLTVKNFQQLKQTVVKFDIYGAFTQYVCRHP